MIKTVTPARALKSCASTGCGQALKRSNRSAKKHKCPYKKRRRVCGNRPDGEANIKQGHYMAVGGNCQYEGNHN